MKKISVYLMIVAAVTATGFFLHGKKISYANFTSQNSEESAYGTGGDDVDSINDDIEKKKKEVEELEEKIKTYENSINVKREEALTLENELSVLEDQITKKSLDIEKTTKLLQTIFLEITKLETKISVKEKEINKQKIKLGDLLKDLYKRDQKTYLEITLSKDSLSEFFQQMKYLKKMQDNVHDALNNVKILKESLESQKIDQVKKKAEAESVKQKLEGEKEGLDGEKEHKNELLDKTKYTEEEFQGLVSSLKQEEEAVNNEVYRLENLAREKLKEKNKDEDKTQDPFPLGPAKLQWPVSSRRITAYFHDPSYPYRYIFEHPAIDIGTAQGSSVYATADGIVAIAKKNDWVKNESGKILYPAYNYVSIIHSEGLSTVYGHLTEVFVSMDEYIKKGDIIGKSGGAPGTKGAGRLTTGAHLHFEVRLNGIPVNPVDYLP